ncbi:YfiR/HmsC family protein [Ekhidna sp.]|uniref:YfiR/HmsC family protein n=1 Tax=Ekhidna sp. TaxID=2608089 RepID=UPI003B50A03F
MKLRITCVSLLVLSTISIAVSQPVKRQKLVAAYIYSFAQNIEWPTDDDSFRIHAITNDGMIIDELNNLSRKREVNGRPITISTSTGLVSFNDIDLVYVSPEFRSLQRAILNRIEERPVLIVSDGYNDQRYVMINFFSSENQLVFEINRANILNQNLSIDENMVLLGGSEIDVARLYKEAQVSVIEMENKIIDLQKKYDELDSKVQETEDIINDQQQIILSQTNEIELKQKTVSLQKQYLDSLQYQFSSTKNQFDSLRGLYDRLQTGVASLEEEIQSQRQRLDEGRQKLESQDDLIVQKEEEIQQREKSLEEMGSIVDSQKNTLFSLTIFLALFTIFLVFLIMAYRARKRDAVKLAKLLSELKDTQSQLVQSEKMASLGVLTAGIAHEINNAINFVYSGIHILNDKFREIKPVMNKVKKLKKVKADSNQLDTIIDEKEKVGYDEAESTIELMMKNIQIGAERTAEIVKGLRTFSRFDSEKISKVNVHKDIEVALLLLQSRYKDIVKVEKKLMNNIPEIEGYKGELSQAFLNIIGNALDALETTQAKGIIVIKTAKVKNGVKITIKDNGEGIEEEKLEKIFDPFFTTKKVGSGTGLGLSITYGIVEKHEGTIDVKSTRGKGTEFTIILPLTLNKQMEAAIA